MAKSRRTFGPAFKVQVVHEAEAGVPLVELARRHEVHPNQILVGFTNTDSMARTPFVTAGGMALRPTMLTLPSWSRPSVN